jgi:MYXO-CTERM domain-containing protein
VAASPVCDSEVASLQTILVADNAIDPQGSALLYEFELYSDVGLTILVASEDDIAQGGGGQTSWSVPVNLVENTTYYWRVRAEDAFTYGMYSATCSFFVNTVNEAPGVPRINTPAFGGQVASLTPNLIVDNATDPDLDVLTYTFEVYADQALSTLIADQTLVVSGATTTSWTVDVNLTEDTTYHWRVRATDDGGLSGDWSTTGQFFVTTVNAPPEAPVLIAPQNGVLVDELRPALIILNADDSDFDVLTYDWEISDDTTFANIVDSGDDEAAQGQSNTEFGLAADLEEDTRYCWRARSDDGAATSEYSTACFLVSTVNDPPSVPTLGNPGDDSTANTVSPTFSWEPSTDPEGETVVYDIEVFEGGDPIASVSGVSGTATSFGEALEDGHTYTWRARASDLDGATSEFSEEAEFTVDDNITPDVVVNGGGCSTGGGAAGFGTLLIGLGLAWRRRRNGRN